jgi:hypothetical protein
MSSARSGGQSGMHCTHVFAGLAVADLPAALAWYERMLGRPPDLVPNWNEAAWQLTDSGWIYVVGDSTRAGKALLTLLVDDLDDRIAEFAERGLAPLRIDTLPNWCARRLSPIPRATRSPSASRSRRVSV